jgi:uncharacterized membrane protein YhaH (DUF805 family)
MEQTQDYNQPQYQQPDYSAVGRPMMPFWTAVKTCFKKYFDFTGRARRSEYWWFVLFASIIYFVWILLCSFFLAFWIATAINGETYSSPMVPLMSYVGLMIVPMLALFIPQYAVQTRRLHDTGRSGWWIVASLVVSLAYMIAYFSVMMPMFENGIDEMPAFFSTPMMIVVAILGMISMLLSVVILIFTVMDSQRGENKYGPSPKYQ